MALHKEFQGNFEDFSYGVVFDPGGRAVPISRFWDKNTAILIFLRHFGCIACRAHAQEIWSNREKLEKAGGRIVFIGNGEPSYIEGFKKDFNLEVAPIFTDPSLKIFKLGGFLRGFTHLVNLKSLSNIKTLASEGHKNGNPLASGIGDNFQMGGVIVVNPGPRVNYHYVSEALGDTPTSNDITTQIL
jgi:hypothetical protein